MALAAAVTVAAVVRLGLHARRDEIEIMKLVGSPVAFIRGPFIAEGLMQGGLGALLAIGLLWMGFALARAWWGGDFAALLEGDDTPVATLTNLDNDQLVVESGRLGVLSIKDAASGTLHFDQFVSRRVNRIGAE